MSPLTRAVPLLANRSCDDAVMGMGAEVQWLTYAEAARRVQKSKRTVQLWRRQGMPMQWTEQDGQRVRVVELDVLLAWWRRKMTASPVHFYQLRKRAVERGETPPPVPERFRARRTPTEQPQGREIGASQPTQVPDGQDDVTGRSETFAQVLADLPPFHGYSEHAVLMAAMEEDPPACDGLEVFTRDRYGEPEEVAMMRDICRSCPLLDLCQAFAAAGKPTGGMWAGMTPAEIGGRVSNATPAAA
ncbi:WhiB family transcriptional regulator [Microbacterium sp. ZW T5_45]|uniref:WhiB family transcriptional regulator n=1 Tax=Microbacterium sp. ZW T5_45 TaxID=3378080 RepID=UPI00385503DD